MTATVTATATVLRIGTRRLDNDRYEGVLRDGKQVVLTCGCLHHNRDTSTGQNGQSARDCIWNLVRSARHPEHAELARRGIAGSAEAYLRTWGTTTSQAVKMRAAAGARADAFTARLPEIAAVIGNRPVYGYQDKITIPPVPPEGVTCIHCGAPLTPDNYVHERGWVNWKDANRDWICPAPGVTGHQAREEC